MLNWMEIRIRRTGWSSEVQSASLYLDPDPIMGPFFPIRLHESVI